MPTGKQTLFFQLLLNKFHPVDGAAVTQCLPEEFRKSVTEKKSPWNDPKIMLKPYSTKIKNVHYSWIVPVLERCPESMKALYAEALPAPTNHRVLALLKLHEVPLATTWAREYLLHDLAKKLELDTVTPIEHLPHSLLSFTLEFSKEELVELIDFLGLYDLAEEIRRIVDKNQLKKIYSCLSVKKQHFLRNCLLSKEKVSTPKLELEKWNGDQESLEKLLHKRGLVRFGKGLSGQPADFIWHIIHRLDNGRGILLSKYITAKEIPGITPLMIQEVLNVHNFFKKMGH